MGNIEDVVLNDIDFIPDSASNKELEELLYRVLEEIACVRSEIEGIKFLATKPQLVNKKCGPKRCKLYYMDKEITDIELKDLTKEMSIAEILKDFKYTKGLKIINPALSDDNENKCRSMINNRTRYLK